MTVCADLSTTKGFCVETISAKEFELAGYAWSSFNRTALKMSPKDYGQIKALILNLCKDQQSCDFEQTKATFDRIERALD